MEEVAEKERLRDYQKRVADWISNQGVFFQLRYAGTVGAGSILKQLGSLFAKLIIGLVFVAAVGYFLLQKHFESASYSEKIEGDLASAFGTSEIKSKGFSRARGSAVYEDLRLEDGEESFFYKAKLEGLSAPIAFLTGLTTTWSPDTVAMSEAQFYLKSGGEDEEMEKAYAGILESLTEGKLSSITINNFSCDWGYSKLTYGKIVNSRLKADRQDGEWVISLEGGSYQQNWLRDFEIIEGLLKVDETGLEVVSLVLEKDNGGLNLSGSVGGPIGQPTFDLNGSFKNLAVEKLFSVDGCIVREFVEGYISGDLNISGSSNSAVKLEGTASPAVMKPLTIRERWPILRAISIIDTQRTFRRIDFQEGSFDFTTGEASLSLTNINLISNDTAQLKGALTTKLPSQSEAAESLKITLTSGFSNDMTDTSAARKLEDDRLSLQNEIRLEEFNDTSQIGQSIKDENLGDIEVVLNTRELEELQMREEMNRHRINGELQLSVPKSAFNGNSYLSKIYKADETGWRWITIPLDNVGFNEISSDANDKLLEQARGKISE